MSQLAIPLFALGLNFFSNQQFIVAVHNLRAEGGGCGGLELLGDSRQGQRTDWLEILDMELSAVFRLANDRQRVEAPPGLIRTHIYTHTHR